jgi:hypothetical protein
MSREVGFMTNYEIPGQNHIKSRALPHGNYATLIYRGNGLRANQALMKWAKANGTIFDSEFPDLAESYSCRYEAYLTDYRIEPRKLLWDVELAIKVAEN